MINKICERRHTNFTSNIIILVRNDCLHLLTLSKYANDLFYIDFYFQDKYLKLEFQLLDIRESEMTFIWKEAWILKEKILNHGKDKDGGR